ncbi:hypothetical protein JHK82_026687 [Glycine max]|nr:hypothetical protein JHK87_026568 [Glycine soja]KAG5002668.1 hypothetical protein JHK86_026807 [Glycine max]KAG5125852.1 hypothetical protein JHK82_026687 [Glycine max]
MAQWIRRWSTEPEILGSIPSGVEQHFEAELLLVLPPTISADGGWCEVSSWHHSGDYGFLDIRFCL